MFVLFVCWFFCLKKIIKGIDFFKLFVIIIELFERMIEIVIVVELDESNYEIFLLDYYDFLKGFKEVLEKLLCFVLEGIINERYVFRKEEFF